MEITTILALFTTIILVSQLLIGFFIGADSGLTVLDKEGVVSSIEIKNAQTAAGEHLGYLELISMMKGIRIRSIIKDSKDRLWFSTYSDFGLVRFDHGNLVTFGVDDGIPSKRLLHQLTTLPSYL